MSTNSGLKINITLGKRKNEEDQVEVPSTHLEKKSKKTRNQKKIKNRKKKKKEKKTFLIQNQLYLFQMIQKPLMKKD